MLLLFGGLVLARLRGFCGLQDMLRGLKHLVLAFLEVKMLLAAVLRVAEM